MWDDMINTVTSVGGLVAVGVGAVVAGGATWYFTHVSEEEQQKHDAQIYQNAYETGKADGYEKGKIDQKAADDVDLNARIAKGIADELARRAAAGNNKQ